MAMKTYSRTQNTFLSSQIQATKQSQSFEVKAPFPSKALVELSNWCNHACVFCTNPRMVRGKGVLDLALYERFIRESVPEGLSEVGLYTTGEPFFVKNLLDYVTIAKEHGVSYVYITTNGALATAEKVESLFAAGLSSLKFSVNAGTRETYKLVHGKDDFEVVLANIRSAARLREEKFPQVRLMASCVVTKHVEKEQQALIDAIGSLVDEIVFVGVGGQGGQSLDQLALLESSMSEKPPALGQAKPCAMLWNRLHLTREGYLTLCCIDYENVLSYADLNQMGVKAAWNNQVIQEIRSRQISQQLEGTLCHNCLYNDKKPFAPLTNIGREPGVGYESNHEKGSRGVAERIQALEELHRN